MWILPEMDIFTIKTVLKRYRGRPPGNIRELFYLDSCLNKDLHKLVDYHVRYTHSLLKLDPKKFSIATRRMEHKLTFGSLIQLTASLHQAKVSYPTHMMYSNQSSISRRPKAGLYQMSRLWKIRKRGGKGKLGGVRTPTMGERRCGSWLRMTTVQFRRKKPQRCTWCKENASQNIRADV